MSDFNLVPESYSYILEQHKDKIKESICIKCSYKDLILNYDDIVENKDLYKNLNHISLRIEKKHDGTREFLKGSIEDKFYSEDSIGDIRVNVFSGYDIENSTIDSHIFVQEKEFEYIKKCINEKIAISTIYLAVRYGMEDDQLLKGILFWSEKSYLSKEWKLSPLTNNILPIYGYKLILETEVEVKRDEYDINEENEEKEKTKRENLREDIDEVLQQHFYEVTSELNKLNKGFTDLHIKFSIVFVVFVIFLLILNFS